MRHCDTMNQNDNVMCRDVILYCDEGKIVESINRHYNYLDMHMDINMCRGRSCANGTNKL